MATLPHERTRQLQAVSNSTDARFCAANSWALPGTGVDPPDATDPSISNERWASFIRQYRQDLQRWRVHLLTELTRRWELEDCADKSSSKERAPLRFSMDDTAAASDQAPHAPCMGCYDETAPTMVCWNCGQWFCHACDPDHDPCGQGHDP